MPFSWLSDLKLQGKQGRQDAKITDQIKLRQYWVYFQAKIQLVERKIN